MRTTEVASQAQPAPQPAQTAQRAQTAKPAQGRRERKKAATRAVIASVALRLFLERGYDHVSVKDVAEAADVAVTTVFQHFSGKEALVFDQDQDREAALVAAVASRAPDQSVLDALQAYFTGSHALTLDPALRDFLHLVHSTPALRDYSRRMWTRHEQSLADAIAASTLAQPGDIAPKALARLSLEALDLAGQQPDPRRALAETFDLLRNGWGDFGRPVAPGR